jgi:hypothetical protein
VQAIAIWAVGIFHILQWASPAKLFCSGKNAAKSLLDNQVHDARLFPKLLSTFLTFAFVE